MALVAVYSEVVVVVNSLFIAASLFCVCMGVYPCFLVQRLQSCMVNRLAGG